MEDRSLHRLKILNQWNHNGQLKSRLSLWKFRLPNINLPKKRYRPGVEARNAPISISPHMLREISGSLRMETKSMYIRRIMSPVVITWWWLGPGTSCLAPPCGASYGEKTGDFGSREPLKGTCRRGKARGREMPMCYVIVVPDWLISWYHWYVQC